MVSLRINKDKNKFYDRNLLLFFIIFGMIFIRYCYYGFEYYYQMDDYIQFYNLLARGVDSIPVMIRMGMLATRPVAAFVDIFGFSPLFSTMILGVLMISALYAASALLLKWVWSRHFGVGYMFLIVYTLLPLGLEGTYWMSAASRVVVGLFFASIALVCFEKWCADGKKHMLILYAVFQLLAYGLYEQIFLFSAASILLVALLNYKEHRSRSMWGLLTFVNAGLYFLFVKQFPANSVYTDRAVLVPPVGSYYWKSYFPRVLDQIKTVFAGGGFYTIVKGFKRGIIILFSDKNYLYALGVLLLSGALFVFTRKSAEKIKKPAVGLTVGLLLALAPLTIFFVISNSWFSLRGTVTSYCGIAIIAEILFTLIFSRMKGYRTLYACTVVAMALIFCTSSISEVHDYKETTVKDQQVVALLAETLKNDGNLQRGQNIGILNLETSYLDDQNFFHHEHIQGVTSSDWSLHGALEWLAGTNNIPYVAPLPQSPMYAPWNSEKMQIGNFDILYLYDGGNNMIQVRAVISGDEKYDLFSLDGKYIGYTWEEDKYGYLVLYP